MPLPGIVLTAYREFADMFDIVLIHPLEYGKNIFTNKRKIFNVPIAIWYLGSYLKSKGLRVRLIDFESNPNALMELKDIAKQTRLIGITMMTSQLNHGLELAKLVKEDIGDIPIVAGGVHPTLYPEETVKSKYIDYAVYGEGEIPLLELTRSLKSGKKEFSHIGGLAYKDKGNIFLKKEKTEMVDHSNYPDLDYTLLDKDFFDPNKIKDYSVPLVTSRGCPFNCLFCANYVLKERNEVRSWSLEKVIYEVKRALDLGFTDIFFWDDNFFINRTKVKRFLEEIKKLDKKFTWYGNTRADFFNEKYLSIEFLTDLNKNGLTRMSIGAESGSQKMLDYMKKGIKVEHIIKAAEFCAKANIEVSFSFMIGTPNEGNDDIKLTVDCMKKIGDILPLPKILGPMLYLPLPGSKMFIDCTKFGYKPPQTIDEWANKSSGYGFSAYARPWIRNPDVVRIVWFYSFLIPISYKKVIRIFRKYCRLTKCSKIKTSALMTAAIIAATIGKLRYRFGFYKFPVEVDLFKNLRSLNSM